MHYIKKQEKQVWCYLHFKDYAQTIIHREDGPAVEWNDGHNRYWLDNVEYSETGYWLEVEKRVRFGNFI